MTLPRQARLPDTMPSPETGRPLIRGVRPFLVTYKGESRIVELPGYYPIGEGEGVHSGADLQAVDDALRSLKAG